MRVFLAAVVLVVSFAACASYRAYSAGKPIAILLGTEKPSHTQAASVATILVAVVLAWISADANSVMFTSIFMGAIGGLVHEIAQSNGEFMLPQVDKQGNYYLGGLFGLIAGGVAGLLLAQGTAQTTVGTGMVSESFLAGLGLKGFADAVAGKRPQAVTPNSDH